MVYDKIHPRVKQKPKRLLFEDTKFNSNKSVNYQEITPSEIWIMQESNQQSRDLQCH